MSIVLASASTTRPAAAIPAGHRMIPGTRIPPSHELSALPPRSGPAEPPSKQSSMCGPWSEMKKTSVSLSTPFAFSASNTLPAAQSISRTPSPHKPFALVSSNSGPLNILTCMCAKA